ncbi:MAG TPA: MarR family transcriptional regulator, partial [Gemmatimonadales bacterium]
MANATATTTTDAAGAERGFGPGLGDTQRAILLALKRLGPATQAEISRALALAPATIREHLQTLASRGLIERRGTRRGKPGRPEVVYGLASEGERLFPRREAEILGALVRYLHARGQDRLVDAFFAARVADRRADALARVAPLGCAGRFAEVARIFSEAGYMARVQGTGARRTLRLCHCPISAAVAETSAPCRYEQELIAELL